MTSDLPPYDSERKHFIYNEVYEGDYDYFYIEISDDRNKTDPFPILKGEKCYSSFFNIHKGYLDHSPDTFALPIECLQAGFEEEEGMSIREFVVKNWDTDKLLKEYMAYGNVVHTEWEVVLKQVKERDRKEELLNQNVKNEIESQLLFHEQELTCAKLLKGSMLTSNHLGIPGSTSKHPFSSFISQFKRGIEERGSLVIEGDIDSYEKSKLIKALHEHHIESLGKDRFEEKVSHLEDASSVKDVLIKENGLLCYGFKETHMSDSPAQLVNDIVKEVDCPLHFNRGLKLVVLNSHFPRLFVRENIHYPDWGSRPHDVLLILHQCLMGIVEKYGYEKSLTIDQVRSILHRMIRGELDDSLTETIVSYLKINIDNNDLPRVHSGADNNMDKIRLTDLNISSLSLNGPSFELIHARRKYTLKANKGMYLLAFVLRDGSESKPLLINDLDRLFGDSVVRDKASSDDQMAYEHDSDNALNNDFQSNLGTSKNNLSESIDPSAIKSVFEELERLESIAKKTENEKQELAELKAYRDQNVNIHSRARSSSDSNKKNKKYKQALSRCLADLKGAGLNELALHFKDHIESNRAFYYNGSFSWMVSLELK